MRMHLSYDLGEYRLVLTLSTFNHYNVDSKALMSFRSLRAYRDNKSVTFALSFELDVFDLSEALSAPQMRYFPLKHSGQ